MSNELSHYTSRDIKKFLGIDKNKLYFWVQTKKLIIPEIEEKGRGKANKFSFKNLLNLALIKRLVEYGMDLGIIWEILLPSSGYSSARGKDIWNCVKDKRKEFDKEGCVLIVIKEKGDLRYIAEKRGNKDIILKEGRADFISEVLTIEEFKKMMLTRPYLEYENFLMIDLLSVIKTLEMKTGNKL